MANHLSFRSRISKMGNVASGGFSGSVKRIILPPSPTPPPPPPPPPPAPDYFLTNVTAEDMMEMIPGEPYTPLYLGWEAVAGHDPVMSWDEDTNTLHCDDPAGVKTLTLFTWNGETIGKFRQMYLNNFVNLERLNVKNCSITELHLYNAFNLKHIIASSNPLSVITSNAPITSLDNLEASNTKLTNKGNFSNVFPSLKRLGFFNTEDPVINISENLNLIQFTLIETLHVKQVDTSSYVSPTNVETITVDPIKNAKLKYLDLQVGVNRFGTAISFWTGVGFEGIAMNSTREPMNLVQLNILGSSNFTNVKELFWFGFIDSLPPLNRFHNLERLVCRYSRASTIPANYFHPNLISSSTNNYKLLDFYEWNRADSISAEAVNSIFSILPTLDEKSSGIARFGIFDLADETGDIARPTLENIDWAIAQNKRWNAHKQCYVFYKTEWEIEPGVFYYAAETLYTERRYTYNESNVPPSNVVVDEPSSRYIYI